MPYRRADAVPSLINVALTFLPVSGAPIVLSRAVRSPMTDGAAWIVTIAVANRRWPSARPGEQLSRRTGLRSSELVIGRKSLFDWVVVAA